MRSEYFRFKHPVGQLGAHEDSIQKGVAEEVSRSPKEEDHNSRNKPEKALKYIANFEIAAMELQPLLLSFATLETGIIHCFSQSFKIRNIYEIE